MLIVSKNINIVETRGILDTEVSQSTAMRSRGTLQDIHIYPDIPEICCAASLAHHGLLGSVDSLDLYNDLASVPPEHLTSLVSCVAGKVEIMNISGCDLVTIIDSVKCEDLHIYNQCLGGEETQALLRAIESRVKYLKLFNETISGCRANLFTLARKRNWKVFPTSQGEYIISRD